MGPLSRLLGTGIGIATEAVHARRNRSRLGSQQGTGTTGTVAGSSVAGRQENPPPAYSERPNQARSRDTKSEYDGDSKKPVNRDGSEDSDSDESNLDADEAAWELDDMSQSVAPPSYSEAAAEQTAGQQQSFVADATDSQSAERITKDLVEQLVILAGPAPPSGAAKHKLAFPVIVPQRRPREKSRGFVRAYAPSLEASGVSQELFLRFLENWDKASKADPWIDVIFLSAQVAGLVPEAIVQAVTMSVSVVTYSAMEIQSRTRRNTFLDRVNRKIFMPRGLYALICTFKPTTPPTQNSRTGPISSATAKLGALVTKESVDINTMILKDSAAHNPEAESMSKLKYGMRNLRVSSGTPNYGELEMPEAAPLIFPHLDKAVDNALRELENTKTGNPNDKGKSKSVKDKFSSAGDFVQDYLDRRAQAVYAQENPNSRLAMGVDAQPTFASRWSDPTHPTNNGSLISLLTGGAVDPKARRQSRRQYRDERKALRAETRDVRRVESGRPPRGESKRQRRGPRRQRKGAIRKLLTQNVLYLFVVNLPTQEEMQASTEVLEREVSLPQA